MPRQSGIHQIKGKNAGMSYYGIKGHQGGFLRRINQEMSARVKSEPNFENTRNYASEFGYAGAMAATSFFKVPGLTAQLSNKAAQGILTRWVRNDLNGAGTGSFGRRYYYGTSWQQSFLDQVNKMSKNNLDVCYPMTYTVTYVQPSDPMTYGMICKITPTKQMADFMRTHGIDRVAVAVQQVECYAGHWDANRNKYEQIRSRVCSQTQSLTLTPGMIDSGDTYQLTIGNIGTDKPRDWGNDPVFHTSGYSRPMVVVVAFRNIGSSSVILQQFSGFKILEQGTIYSPEISV